MLPFTMMSDECDDPKLDEYPETDELSLDKVLYALSDHNRLQIVVILHQAKTELRCGVFAQQLDITKPTLTYHLRILRSSGLVKTRVEGTAKFNSLRKKELNQRFPGLLNSILKAAGFAERDF